MSDSDLNETIEPPASVSEQLPIGSGRALWRSLDELAGTDSFEAYVRRAYPSQAHKLDDPPERREFLKLMGASLALAGAGVSGCTRQPREKILPYAKTPESIVPGQPLYFATAMPWASGAIGLLVESHMGRPTKIEGNPEHSASGGATDVFAQGAVLDLYDPERSRVVSHRGRIATWDQFLTVVSGALPAIRTKGGAGLAILSGSITSPTLAAQKRALLAELPMARWHQFEPLNRDAARSGALLAFGQDLVARPRFDAADVVLSLEGDFLGPGPDSVRAIRDFTARRKVRVEDTRPIHRLYVVESALTNTGACADHRLALPSSQVELFARALARRLGIQVEAGALPEGAAARAETWIGAVAKDLEEHRGTSVVVTGDGQSPAVHALVHAINARLGNAGLTVEYRRPAALESGDETRSLAELADVMRKGAVEMLVVLGGNPVYDAPVDLDFAGALARVPLRIRLGLYDDETSNRCDWHVNEAHWLESWSDCRAADGTASVIQPLIAPLYGGRSAHDVVAAIANQAAARPYDLVREHWRTELGAPAEFERAWRRALHDGLWPGTGEAPVTPTLRDFVASLPAPARAQAAGSIEIVFRPDPSVWDGRFANNGWLQELPRPLSKLVWDNAAHVSPRTAERLGLEPGDVTEIELGGRKLEAAVWIAPGQADDSIALFLGYGRARAGSVGTGVGHDANRLRTSASMSWATGARITKTGASHRLVSTQGHDTMEGRDIVRVTTIDRFRANPHLFTKPGHGAGGSAETSLFPDPSLPARQGHAWGMAIDLNACTACNACVVACQSENNVPVVGKREVDRGREMHWLRIDRYFEGARERPRVLFQPLMCMHCETAPCEYVCPVAATTHSPEGLNEMTYNRCVGTRYCANNCPYKVRRFNFFLYADFSTESLALQRNPDVTVRSRGVMEKCSYCVQRINQARIQAKKEDRPIQDGEIVTACQQVCPADAIVFGDLNDPGSRVSKQKSEPHDYGLLEELNTKPRTTYLARIRNPNPDLES